MALITCPECGREISEYAESCIGCGCPMQVIKEHLKNTQKTEVKKEVEAPRNAKEAVESQKEAVCEEKNLGNLVAWRKGYKINGVFHGDVLFCNKLGVYFNEKWEHGVLKSRHMVREHSRQKLHQKDYLLMAHEGKLRAFPNDYISILFGILSREELEQWCIGPFEPQVRHDSFTEESGEDDFVQLSRALQSPTFWGIPEESKNPRCAWMPLGTSVINPLYYEYDISCVELLLNEDAETVHRIVHYSAYVLLPETNNDRNASYQIVSRDEYERFEKTNQTTHAYTGAEAIGVMLQSLCLQDEYDSTEQELNMLIWEERYGLCDAESVKKIPKLLLRRNLIKFFLDNQIQPQWLVIDAIPIAPVEVRRSSRREHSEIDRLYISLIRKVLRHKRLLELAAPQIILMNEKRMIQESVDEIIKRSFTRLYSDNSLESLFDMMVSWHTEKREYSNGAIYDGMITNEKRNGIGIMILPDGCCYVGNWVDGTRCGEGKEYLYNGDCYIGTYVDGKPHGRGIYIKPDGETFEGTWENGVRNGEGTIIYSDGTKNAVYYINGLMV